ncbi:MAG: cobalamin B12-binding domain-containing protein [Deltaproteobacteria bacterium]|nr:cobalamin B12-binding domain-containing protein [Deltaproteobacteria bacterium]
MSKPLRVLIAKPGLDGHDVGAKLVCRALMEAGMEVIYTGLRQSPAAIAKTALEEGVDAIGLSILSGAHLPLCRKVVDQLKSKGLDDAPLFVGGNIPRRDHQQLNQLGIAGIFPTGSDFDQIVKFIQTKVTK